MAMTQPNAITLRVVIIPLSGTNVNNVETQNTVILVTLDVQNAPIWHLQKHHIKYMTQQHQDNLVNSNVHGYVIVGIIVVGQITMNANHVQTMHQIAQQLG